MRDIYLPVTPDILREWANRSLQRAGRDQTVSKMWAYRFEKRLPPALNLGPIRQKPKDKHRIEAEDIGSLLFWYNQLANLIGDRPARLIYNMDECGFRPGECKPRKVIGSQKRYVPDLATLDHAETITAVECIAADGWQMEPLFIYKGQTLQESWYHPMFL